MIFMIIWKIAVKMQPRVFAAIFQMICIYWSRCSFMIFLSCWIMELPKAQFLISAYDLTKLRKGQHVDCAATNEMLVPTGAVAAKNDICRRRHWRFVVFIVFVPKDLTKFLYFAGLASCNRRPFTRLRCAHSSIYWSNCSFLIFFYLVESWNYRKHNFLFKVILWWSSASK